MRSVIFCSVVLIGISGYSQSKKELQAKVTSLTSEVTSLKAEIDQLKKPQEVSLACNSFFDCEYADTPINTTKQKITDLIFYNIME